MGALRDLIDRIGERTNALVSPAGGSGQPAKELNLPGLLTVLALGQRTKPLADTLPTDSDVDRGQIVNRENIEAILAAIAKRQGVPISPDEAREVITLLTTGEFFKDLGVGLTAAVRLVPGAPIALVKDALDLKQLPDELVKAIREDLHDDPHRPPRDVLADLLSDGRLDDRGRILTHTLGVLLNRAAPKVLVDTLRTLIAPENQTFRLAIVVYARLNGVNIDVEDLDAVYNALDPANPDLGRLVDRGLERVHQKYEKAQIALAFLRKLSPTG